MIDLDLEAIRKQLSEITESPWEADLEDGCVDAGGITVCSITHHGWVRTELSTGTKFKHADVTFIAQAPQTISKLVAEVERERACFMAMSQKYHETHLKLKDVEQENLKLLKMIDSLKLELEGR